MVQKILFLLLSILLLFIGRKVDATVSADSLMELMTKNTESATPESQNSKELILSVNGVLLPVTWEDNDSIAALYALAEEGIITVHTENYGRFEQVGTLPQSIVNNDVEITTTPGDIVLYSGNALVLFYGSNTWTYTKLGHIDGFSADAYETLLSGSKTTVTLSLSEE
ncbi:MAG: hypothetical protein HFE66_04680 [Clostridiales bacterium]|jgi:hypothetical protein|nr:hypothetical protein [Clostridiales bacterium]